MRVRRWVVPVSAALSLACGGTLVAPEVPAECATILRNVERTGLALPGNFGFRCPAKLDRWGITSWNGTTGYVALDLDNIADWGVSPEFVLAHEICHAWRLNEGTSNSEAEADACANERGFVL